VCACVCACVCVCVCACVSESGGWSLTCWGTAHAAGGKPTAHVPATFRARPQYPGAVGAAGAMRRRVCMRDVGPKRTPQTAPHSTISPPLVFPPTPPTLTLS